MATRNPFHENMQSAESSGRVGDYNGKSWGVEFEPHTTHQPISLTFTSQTTKRFVLFLVFVLAVFVTYYARIGQLQIVRGETLSVVAEANRIRVKPIKASRGILYDRTGEQLVRNVPNQTLQIIPIDFLRLQDLPDEAGRLATLLGEQPDALTKELLDRQQALKEKKKKPAQAIDFRDHLSNDVTLKLRLAENDLPGFRITETATREYLAGTAFSHVLGYTGKISETESADLLNQGYNPDDEIGKTGFEKTYESSLRGKDGQEQVEVDARGRELRVVSSENPVAGTNMVLSLDAGLQRKAQEVLDAQVKKSNASGGAFVALDPRNGQVLALVSSPAYDNNTFVNGTLGQAYTSLINDPARPLYNRALAGQYPPGSTIKPLIAANALHQGIITAATTVLSTGGIRIGQWFFPDWKAGGHGVTDVKKAIAESINTFFYTIGGGTDTFTGLGIDRLTKGLEQFGLGKRTGIDLPGERPGFMPSPDWKKQVKKEQWYIGDTYHLSIGQGDVLVTPLQMATATSAIANGGTLFEPQLLLAQGSTVTDAKPVEPKIGADSLTDTQSLDIVRQGMRQAVVAGSARAMSSLPVEVAGKTGTAQFGPSKQTHAWFTMFAPYTDPNIAIAVIVEGGGEGHAAALPVAHDVLQWYYQQKPHVDNKP